MKVLSVNVGRPRAVRDGNREVTTAIFKAPATGSFRIFCGVPGHGQSGMWIRFKVDPNAKTPSWVTS